eukprot:CAMPEP_0183365988 /NCGR_PEP_ID=MMETSP0164_2-20130417/86905_1 /TAXON_ID=221442 /ORGANISM="Coccolithus pelagicus ssp braarudi, Strain PLY182g" /LENGTH=177 /DNA_ID=CAMNT_0025541629 /DNA_START=209 /DNA_END=738 /DNA_ORIENTATION=+
MAVLSCDLEATEAEGSHFQGDVRALLALKWWPLIVAFPPCTHTAYNGSQYFREKCADGRQWAGLCIILELLAADAEAVVVEQPRSAFGEVHRPPDVACHPYHFGDGEQKQTLLWCAGRAPLLRATNVVNGRNRRSAKVWSPTAVERRRRRSIIPLGFADALAAQIRPDTLLPHAEAR